MKELDYIFKAQKAIEHHQPREAIISLSNIMARQIKHLCHDKLGPDFFSIENLKSYNFRDLILISLEQHVLVDMDEKERLKLNQMIRVRNKAVLNLDNLKDADGKFFLEQMLLFLKLNPIN